MLVPFKSTMFEYYAYVLDKKKKEKSRHTVFVSENLNPYLKPHHPVVSLLRAHREQFLIKKWEVIYIQRYLLKCPIISARQLNCHRDQSNA